MQMNRNMGGGPALRLRPLSTTTFRDVRTAGAASGGSALIDYYFWRAEKCWVLPPPPYVELARTPGDFPGGKILRNRAVKALNTGALKCFIKLI